MADIKEGVHENVDISDVLNDDIVVKTCTNDAANRQHSSINFDKEGQIKQGKN